MSGSRPKGYMTWNPSPEIERWVHLANGILDEYAQYGPMTVRQIFYRLVGQHGYPKDERAYKRLGEYLVKARRSGLVRFGRIRDDGTISHSRDNEFTRSDVWEDLVGTISEPERYLHLNRRNGQPVHIELWCEAGGMAPMLAQMVRSRDVSVYSTGGFSSVTVTWEVAQRIARRERPTHFLHVGDYDPSGESIFTSMSQDIGAFVASKIGGFVYELSGKVEDSEEREFFVPRRVALTEEQVEEFDLPTAPPKASDSRSANWIGDTTQAEAMPPDLLERVIIDALDELTDDDALQNVEDQENDDRQRLKHAIDGMTVRDLMDARELDEDATLLDLVTAMSEHDQDAGA